MSNKNTPAMTARALVQQRLARLDRMEKEGKKIVQTTMLAAFMRAVA